MKRVMYKVNVVFLQKLIYLTLVIFIISSFISTILKKSYLMIDSKIAAYSLWVLAIVVVLYIVISIYTIDIKFNEKK